MGAVVRRLILQRLAQLPIVIIGATFASFVVVNVLPGNPAIFALGGNGTPQQIAQVEQQLGLNHPLLDRYWNWIWAALHGNLGTSYTTHIPVTQEINRVLPPTVELVVYGIVIAIVLSSAFAFWSAWTRSRVLDRFLTAVTLGSHCLPGFVLGLILLYIFSVKLGWIPSIPYVPFSEGIGKNLGYMFIPSFTLAMGLFPTQMRVLRGDLVDQLSHEEYVQLAWLKGLTKAQVIFRHVAKNAAAGFVTIIGIQLGILFGGVILIEQVFTIDNGFGFLLEQAITTHDVTTVEGLLLIISTIVVVANLLADLMYMVLDPRVRYS